MYQFGGGLLSHDGFGLFKVEFRSEEAILGDVDRDFCLYSHAICLDVHAAAVTTFVILVMRIPNALDWMATAALR